MSVATFVDGLKGLLDLFCSTGNPATAQLVYSGATRASGCVDSNPAVPGPVAAVYPSPPNGAAPPGWIPSRTNMNEQFYWNGVGRAQKLAGHRTRMGK